jgi:hypothetical protein
LLIVRHDELISYLVLFLRLVPTFFEKQFLLLEKIQRRRNRVGSMGIVTKTKNGMDGPQVYFIFQRTNALPYLPTPSSHHTVVTVCILILRKTKLIR